jgi:hypothetical protein
MPIQASLRSRRENVWATDDSAKPQAEYVMSMKLIAESISGREEKLESLIEHRLGNRIRDLRVVVRETGLVLQGRAATYHAKQLAQHAAMEVGTLPILSNEIEVF